MRSSEEFDQFLATHKAGGQFVRLNYGLAPPKKIMIGKDPGNGSAQQERDKNRSYLTEWWKSNRCSMKAQITIGTFLTSD